MKIQASEIMQPKDKNDPLYKTMDDLLERTDLKRVAIDLGVLPCSVSAVKNGHDRSKRIWKRLMETVLQKKAVRDEVTKYLQSV